MLVVRLTGVRPGSGRPKSVRKTDNVAVAQDLISSQDDEVMRPVPCGAPYRSTFNCAKFSAEYLLQAAAYVCQKLSDLVKTFQR